MSVNVGVAGPQKAGSSVADVAFLSLAFLMNPHANLRTKPVSNGSNVPMIALLRLGHEVSNPFP